MNVRELLENDDAVSPVIGVILMVAITVILAAVIATFVLGLGEQVSSTSPTATINAEWNGSTNSAGNLTFIHAGGDTIKASNLYFRGNNGSGSGSTLGLNEPWSNFTSGVTEIQAGMSADIGEAANDAVVRVVWQNAEGSSSATLKEWSGPNA